MTTLHLKKSIACSPWRRGYLLIVAALCCFGLAPAVQAVNPPPDGGYPGDNTAEGQNALFSLTTGTANTATGFNAPLLMPLFLARANKGQVCAPFDPPARMPRSACSNKIYPMIGKTLAAHCPDTGDVAALFHTPGGQRGHIWLLLETAADSLIFAGPLLGRCRTPSMRSLPLIVATLGCGPHEIRPCSHNIIRRAPARRGQGPPACFFLRTSRSAAGRGRCRRPA